MGWQTWGLKRSPWVYHVNVGACNNCDIEVLELLTPRYDVERFGITLVGSPRHADALLVTGVCTRQAEPRLRAVYEQTPKPCVVFCIGVCACTGGIFRHAYGLGRPVDVVIREIDPQAIIAYVPGCPPKPGGMILGAVKALGTL
jgi:membrane-bound hydrogenase subunit mbhJ